MKVRELIDMLEDMPEDAEVRIAYQPNYPLQVAVACVTDLTSEIDEDDLEEDADEVSEENRAVYIATGSPTASGYAPRGAWGY